MLYTELTSPELGRTAPGAIAVLPLAAVEQHGDHLPVVTDTAIATEFARLAEAAMPEQIVLLPTLWVGSSHHHLGFPGTLSISSETYVRVVRDLVECLIATGFRRIFLLNGHGGNQTPFAEALFRLGQDRQDLWVVAQSYWKLAAKEMAAANFMQTPALSHACEYETSLMLALREDWVKMNLAKGNGPSLGSAFYDRQNYEPSRVVVSETFKQMTPNGAMGSPELGTAVKGRKLFETISPVIIEFLREFSTWPLPNRIKENSSPKASTP
mgnify:CR=1 FL=1|jgi:creatinine amidohydrolase